MTAPLMAARLAKIRTLLKTGYFKYHGATKAQLFDAATDLLAAFDAAETARRDAEAMLHARARPLVIEEPWCPACKMAHAPFESAR